MSALAFGFMFILNIEFHMGKGEEGCSELHIYIYTYGSMRWFNCCAAHGALVCRSH